MNLTVLCITEGGHHARPFLERHEWLARTLGAELVVGADGILGRAAADGLDARIRTVRSDGSLESVLDEMVHVCEPGYVLRLDDDEACSAEMVAWLDARAYEEHDHWSFPRANLYPDEGSYATTDPLWPDNQTRLSVREKSGGRPVLHCGSPFGPGRVAPVVLEHHKFVVRGLAERRRALLRNERALGAAPYYRIFSVPEDFDVDTAPYGRARVAA